MDAIENAEYQAGAALGSFIGAVEQVANAENPGAHVWGDGRITDELDMVTAELFDAHSATAVMLAMSSRHAKLVTD